jgi:hypothetical protein
MRVFKFCNILKLLLFTVSQSPCNATSRASEHLAHKA